ncbi:TetR/AcrR family transcriptional regulator [Burkholderia pseudomultivorans]|uniref:TetR/AcrR family transcriptional regulator n=1 Tax=Burkholderia pseudomultivorans TaxID=1207504 RepID=UPI000756F162|nr:TetR/AcrR family transcriptional regulator [Burkholderia pseudomultivorans]KVG62235.1 TetR family transcriptional regulator [Burkholderia pseudomultivorans]
MTDRTRTAKDDAPAARTPRTKPAEVRLDELMAAAEKLFLAQGVEATTISEIVEHAQVAKGTFYHYFDSKADMLAALAQRYTASFLERLQQAVDACDADDWLGRLRAWIRASIDAYAATYRTHDIVYTNHHHHDRANPDRNAILDQLGAILEGGAQAGAWRLAHPQVTALLIYAGVHGATDHLIAAPQTDRHAFVEAVVGDCLRMLGIEDPARRRV